MMTSHALQDLERRLRDERVLSVYVDARVTDPAMRNAWRPALTAAVRAERARLTDAAELAAFDRAAGFLDDPVPPLTGAWGPVGWVAFLTASGPRYAAALPVRVPTLVVWRDGLVVSPYLRALKQHRPVIVALVDSRSARLYRYALGMLAPLPDIAISTAERADAPAKSPSLRGTSYPGARSASYPGARSALSTERGDRSRRKTFERLATTLAARLTSLAGDDGWVLIGGTPEWARLAGEAMPVHLADRTMVSLTLDGDRPEPEIARAAREAASTLRADWGRAMLRRLLERAGAAGRAAAGIPATQRALREHAVDQLVLSPAFVRTNADLAEDAVRAALAQGADVEVLSSDAATQLDDAAGGVAAQLRFAVDSPSPATTEGARWASGRAEARRPLTAVVTRNIRD
jgi:hypothetical protein